MKRVYVYVIYDLANYELPVRLFDTYKETLQYLGLGKTRV